MSDLTHACSQIIALIEHFSQDHHSPILAALDGCSGAGKSTLAHLLEEKIDCVIVQLDDFFAGNIPDQEWDSRTVAERVRDVFNWKRVREDALNPLLQGQIARWHPFDFAGGLQPDGTYGMSELWIERQPASVIIIEGAYSSSPQLADLIDLTIFVDVPIKERHKRIHEREKDEQFMQRWHSLWDDVEKYYFSEIMPKASFDLVVSGE
jgi:uridine kinase